VVLSATLAPLMSAGALAALVNYEWVLDALFKALLVAAACGFLVAVGVVLVARSLVDRAFDRYEGGDERERFKAARRGRVRI